jgi:hypothetical protein
MKRNQKTAPRLDILPLKEFAGVADSPHYSALAEAEATELTEGPGGRFTFASLPRRERRSGKYEREALALRERALAKL